MTTVDSKMLHVEITRAYHIAVVDNSGKELVSDFTFLSKAEAEAIGKRMKQDAEKLGAKMKREIEAKGN